MSSTSKFKATPTYSFKGRTQRVTSSNLPSTIPSPNCYNPQKISKKKSPQIKFALSNRKQWRINKSQQLSPGPGTHQLPSCFTFKSTIKQHKSQRKRERFVSSQSLTPGPNTYNNNYKFLKKSASAFTIQKKTKSQVDLINDQNKYKPGPGTHEQPLNKNLSTNIKIGKSLRPNYISKIKSPGPGSYKSQQFFDQSVSSDRSKTKFCRQKRNIDFSLGQRSPGPCIYNKKNFMEQFNKKQFSIRQKFNPKTPTQKFPGPGQYESSKIMKQKSAPMIRIGKQTRVCFTDKNNKLKISPGPGAHDLQNKQRYMFRSISSCKFKGKNNIDKRKSYLSQINIGPGQYSVEKSIQLKQKSQPRFSIDSQTKRKSFTDDYNTNPGPAQYDPKTNLLQKSQSVYRISKSARPNIIKHLQRLPGPGQYNIPCEKRLGRQFKFSKEKKKYYIDQKMKNQKAVLNQSYQNRQQFPNPPKYHGVTPKITFNQKVIAKYL